MDYYKISHLLFIGCSSEFTDHNLSINCGFWKIICCKTQVTSTSDVCLLQDWILG